MRRPAGTGSVYLHDGIWRVQYFVEGRRIRESSHSRDKKVAEQLLAKRLGESAAEILARPTAERCNLGHLIDLVIEDYKFREHRDTRIVAYRAAAHFDEAFRKKLASKFGTDDIQRYVASRRAQEASNGTINRELGIIRRGFILGHRRDPQLVLREPPYIPQLDEDNVRQGFLEQDQYERLLTELPDRLKALFVCAYHVGARKGELRKIRWEQVDWDARVIRVEKAQAKSKKPRTIPIYGDMGRWLTVQKDSCLPDCPWVFHYRGGAVGAHLDGWDEACERAGLPGLLFHDLRRSAVRNMKRAGIPDVVAMSISGHQTRAIFDRYNIVDEDDLANAGEALEKYAARRKAERAAKLVRVK